jgi:GH15 family glucan-1,4-alpha-glucosidase
MTAANLRTLDLAPIGNCTVSALVDRAGRFVWACAPRVDGDPVFSALLDTDPFDAPQAKGFWSVDLEGQASVQQDYLRNTAILRTVLEDERGGAVEIIDFAPRYRHYGRNYRPIAFVRMIRPIGGAPRITVRLRPAADWGKARAPFTFGSNHIRFLCPDVTLRLTTNCPVSHVVEERTFRLEQPLAFFLGPDEKLTEDVAQMCDKAFTNTCAHWREWVRTLTLPLDWQAPVIRAAIALKLCAYEETGAIVAALTTSIPEHADSGRNWDYRYCWIRDAYYVVRALNRLGASDMLENYLGYLRNLVDLSQGGHVQPVYGVGLEPALIEREAADLPGYRGMGPVRVGNQAHEHLQHDVYGQIVLPLVQSFFDERLLRPGTYDDFHALEKVGDRAFEMYDKPDAGLWEFRTKARVHTYSALLCWAACSRLANAARQLELTDRCALWEERAATIRARIEAEAFDTENGRFAGSFGGQELDASLLQLIDLGFVPATDPRMAATIDGVETELRRGSYMFRYADPDDFGAPQTAFNFCTFWFIEALHEAGRDEEARDLFRQMLDRRTHSGLLSEDIGLEDGELWGNYPQTYSLVGLINCAHLLSRPWSAVR